MTNEYKEMIEAIKQGRKQRGFTQDDFAKMLNMTKVTYQRYETLQTDMPVPLYMLACQILRIETFKRKEDETSLIAINPNDVMDRFNNVATKDDISDVYKKIDEASKKSEERDDDMNKKLEEILSLFNKKKK
jgi:transcriptional regulator with XRE-family HTH domain